MRNTKRRYRPNIQSTKMLIGGEQVRVKICTRCLRTQNKAPAA